MDFIVVCIFITLGIIIISFIGYKVMTDKIIKDQEKEIAKLKTETFRLQAKLKNKSNVKTIEIYDNTIAPGNIPEFGNI